MLGAHHENGGVVVRAFRPAAESVSVHPAGGDAVRAEQVHPAGVFEAAFAGAELPLDYELEVAYPDGNTFTLRDPYAFLPTLGELDVHLAGEGRHECLYDKLGAHVRTMDGVSGTAFAVWAPAAATVSVVGDFNSWDGRLHPMRALGSSGIWELFVPDVASGQRYKFEIHTPGGELRLKADPYAQAAEHPPETSSVVHESHYDWGDTSWMTRREAQDQLAQPMSIYEVHLGSWRRTPGNRSLSYVELADELSAYVADMNFTHVELMPVMAHPFEGSWGYQVTSHFAPTPRYGSPDELKAFIDRLHQNGVGVILDWVPAHFPKDDWALARFDGTALYEHEDPRRGAHPEWGTLEFNFGRNEVRNFLVSSGLYWLDEYHADGLRVDAVASMLYLDYSREAGQWVPNEFGGNEDLEAVGFLKQLNESLYAREAGALSAAESTPGTSAWTTSLSCL
ncbi:MAG: 1,4-alpha-glucan branching enzyme, partial [Solirubrobacteraceae bacterium]|nr:1,4-alpha-glucan branching enzyme [Solirubrobacteraceae bacterium]